MNLEFKEFITNTGEIILYNGTPDLSLFNELAAGPGDIWHSSFEQGFKNLFPELIYQVPPFWWYTNDFDNLNTSISWRINPNSFAVRKQIWEKTKGFETDFDSIEMQALDYGYNGLSYSGTIPLYVKNLFKSDEKVDENCISINDRYKFYRKNFKIEHSFYMLLRIGFWKISEWKAFFNAKKTVKKRKKIPIINSRELKEIKNNPTVSYIIPTMFRQDYTLQLLDDLANQSYKISQVVIVDATPKSERDETLYTLKTYPFTVDVIWQTSKGSCRARNEGIELCTGDYIVFGDDDIRVLPNYIENHIKFLQTYNAGACNGLDIRADHHEQNLIDLESKQNYVGKFRWRVGATSIFSNANSCVERKYVNQLVGNDVNFDGGYGEDSDFGLSLVKIGVVVLCNPHAINLHLKPPSGGYRWWNAQAKILGNKRKVQPWELDTPVKNIKPVPSPTIMYGVIKQFSTAQQKEYKYKHFLYYLIKGKKRYFIYRIARLYYKNLQYKKAVFYANKLIKLGIRHK